MSTAPTVSPADHFETVRARSLAVLDRIVEASTSGGLPRPPDALEACRRKLREDRYVVLVAGEAKRGKSTFVNAILGRDLLPTDVAIATSQVFCVRHAEEEGYCVRFEDGSARQISAEDLPRFGSQVLADAGALPRLDQVIRWIEVDGPRRFLPRGIALLDTPGLGSLYAAHERVTQRFVPEADAVIFVLGSDSPISREEVAFLDKILGVTRNVLLVQTMIDRYRREDWQAIQARNEQVLADRFGDRLPDRRAWPVSSTNLLKSAQTGDRDYEQVSKFHPLAAALQTFLVRAAGWGRAAEAVFLARAAHQAATSTLSTRLAVLIEAGGARQAGPSQLLREQPHQFERQWGEGGRQREELLAGVRQAAASRRHELWRYLQPGCPTEVELQERIDAVNSLDQARRLATELSPKVVEAAAEQWRKMTGRFQSDCVRLLGPFVAATGLLGGVADDAGPNLAVRSGKGLRLSDDSFFKAMTAADQFAQGTAVAGTAGLVLTLVIATSWFPPVAIAGAVAAGIWGAIRGWRLTDLAQVEAARAALHQHLSEVSHQVRRHFFEGDAVTGCLGIADHFLDSQVDLLTSRVAALAAEKLEEARVEATRLAEAARFDERQRQAKADEARGQQEEWAAIGQLIEATQAELRACEPKFGW